MKLKHLTMQAFGSFAGKTEIDFASMEGVWLVTGATGSGKTMIFDAVMYALYGRTSGGARSASDMRSAYVSPEVETYVELVFEQHGEEWTVRRSLDYERPKLRGEGTTTVHGADSLMCATQSWGKNINEKLTEVIGVTAQQFNQLAMIAQNEFTKILRADTDERKKLLRKLLNTEKYEAFQFRLKSRNDAAESAAILSADRLASEASHFLWDGESLADEFLARWVQLNRERNAPPEDAVLDGMDAQCARETLLEKEADDAVRPLEEQLNSLIARQSVAASLHARFVRLAGLKKQEKADSALLPEKHRQRAELERKQDALDIRPFLITREKVVKEIGTRTVQLQNAEREDLAGQQGKREAEEAFLEAGQLEPEKQKTDGEILRLTEILPLIGAIAQEEQRLQEKNGKAVTALKKVREAEARAEELRHLYYTSQAAMLAAELEENKPCPVCGSLQHPHPCPAGEKDVKREELEAAETQVLLFRDASAAANSAYETAKGILEKEKERFAEACAKLGLETDTADSVTRAAEFTEGLDRAKEKSRKLGERIKTLTESKNLADRKAAELAAALRSAKEELEKAGENRTEAEKALTQALEAHGFREVAEAEALMPDRTRTELQAEISAIDRWTDALGHMKTEIAELETELAGKEDPDPEAFGTAIDGLREKIEALRDAGEDVRRRAKTNRDCLRLTREKREEYRKAKENAEFWGELFRSTQSSRGGLTFEIYVQRYYFERVVRLADMHLRDMTGGILHLRLQDPDSRGNTGYKGLDLVIEDDATGRERNVATLSGGESFMASMALALGLSDLVSTDVSNVDLGVLFIDEGFGTLDEESLQQILRVLNALTENGGKLVNLISHRPELKEAIKNQIRVEKTRKGSSLNVQYR